MKMDKNLHIPQGYRQTEVGVIPDDWRIVKIGDVFDFIKTYSNSRNDLSDIGEIEYLHYGDIHTKYKYHLDFDKNVLPKISFEKFKTNIEYVKNGDLFIADASENYADIGKSVETVNLYNKKVVSGLHTFLLRDKGNNFSNKYKGLILYNQNVSKTIKKIATGVSVLGISKTNLNKLKIPLPPKQEQQKIADILTTWDNAINQQTTLIEKKQQLKKGLMQQLLTAKTRFSEFSDDWKKVKLSYVLFIPNKVKPIKIDKNKLLTVKLHLKGIARNENTDTLLLGASYFIRNKGDFIFGKQNIFNGAFGILNDKFDGYLSSSDVPALGLKDNINSEFCLFMFSKKSFFKKLEFISIGTGSKRVHEKELLKVKIKLPTIEEQQKIAQILTLADNEITKLQTELALLKTQKKGLMQQLLTGKIRTKT